MPEFHFNCGACGKEMVIDSNGAGLQVTCCHCKVEIQVPQSTHEMPCPSCGTPLLVAETRQAPKCLACLNAKNTKTGSEKAAIWRMTKVLFCLYGAGAVVGSILGLCWWSISAVVSGAFFGAFVLGSLAVVLSALKVLPPLDKMVEWVRCKIRRIVVASKEKAVSLPVRAGKTKLAAGTPAKKPLAAGRIKFPTPVVVGKSKPATTPPTQKAESPAASDEKIAKPQEKEKSTVPEIVTQSPVAATSFPKPLPQAPLSPPVQKAKSPVASGGGSASDSCPSCGASLQPGFVICVNCGLNFKTGERLKTTASVVEASASASPSYKEDSPRPKIRITEVRLPGESAPPGNNTIQVLAAFTCPECKAEIEAPESTSDMQMKCPSCLADVRFRRKIQIKQRPPETAGK